MKNIHQFLTGLALLGAASIYNVQAQTAHIDISGTVAAKC